MNAIRLFFPETSFNMKAAMKGIKRDASDLTSFQHMLFSQTEENAAVMEELLILNKEASYADLPFEEMILDEEHVETEEQEVEIDDLIVTPMPIVEQTVVPATSVLSMMKTDEEIMEQEISAKPTQRVEAAMVDEEIKEQEENIVRHVNNDVSLLKESANNTSALPSFGDNQQKELARMTEQLMAKVNASFDRKPVHYYATPKTFTAIDEIQIQQQMSDIVSQFQHLVESVEGPEKFIHIAPKVIELLKKWTNLESVHKTDFTLVEQEPKLNGIWQELVQRYSVRNGMYANAQYALDAGVTARDVSKWMQALYVNEQQVMNEPVIPVANAQTQTMPMSKVEQYIIHLNHQNTEETVEQQLINRFNQVMKASRFLTFKNGVSQLTFSIRPEHLGEMTVRLMKVDGDMVVKIIVNSQATRQMLETNIHQLKNTFAPHQVVIEEVDSREQVVQKEQPDHEQAFKEEQEKSNASKHQLQNNQEDEDAIDFQEVLMNVKV